MDHEYFMRMALNLARKGQGYTSPNPMVGAVIVKNGAVVGRGYHRAAGQAHAEVEAIDDAGIKARGASLYVNLEPCNHTGRTPPCTRYILKAGIRRVIMAMADPHTKAGGGAAFLQQNGIDVLSGVCEKQAARLNEAFVTFVSTGCPFVIVKCAATLDGRIATRTGDSQWVTGEKARRFVHRLRHAVDAILVGIGTVRADNPRLTTRLNTKNGVDPDRIVLDTHLSISPDAKILSLDSDADTLLIAGKNATRAKRKQLQKEGVRIIDQPLEKGRIDLKSLIVRLGSEGITSLLIEGGSTVLASAFNSGIVDKVLFFYAPKILGGDDGMPICRGSGPAFMKDSIQLKHIRVQRFAEDVMIEGYIR
jgi:diaminohydroxyphosphoribosylaminopyrimidine deaminase/5-amino-6-(5-phosphoribosylamino)uracil reductase